jgi:hypothetical protein
MANYGKCCLIVAIVAQFVHNLDCFIAETWISVAGNRDSNQTLFSCLALAQFIEFRALFWVLSVGAETLQNFH